MLTIIKYFSVLKEIYIIDLMTVSKRIYEEGWFLFPLKRWEYLTFLNALKNDRIHYWIYNKLFMINNSKTERTREQQTWIPWFNFMKSIKNSNDNRELIKIK